jgi:hypothetical protein
MSGEFTDADFAKFMLAGVSDAISGLRSPEISNTAERFSNSETVRPEVVIQIINSGFEFLISSIVFSKFLLSQAGEPSSFLACKWTLVMPISETRLTCSAIS